ncbi:23S rRNA (adenine(1618)-N(6))-methyltransferase RlmF [Glaciecola sp. MH2013]|nr:23S rRNA (adenine(1618)-N(6))-methyltransferase RlmF [Glaciecola sp. MH2013]
MHPRNPHNKGYNFDELATSYSPLKAFLVPKADGKHSIDFAQPEAVKALNAALLSHYYKVHFWDIPSGFLCPAVPGRADYIHYIADLLKQSSSQSESVIGLDIGTGANLIYPIIASQSYGWQMIGSDINPISFASAKAIAKSNKNLSKKINLRFQNEKSIFKGIINDGEYFSFTMCNPPFHESAAAAMSGSRKKNKNLARHKHKRQQGTEKNSSAIDKDKLNFGGQQSELWCDGGEFRFVKQMIEESVRFSQQVGWFTSLLSKKENAQALLEIAKHAGATEQLAIQMAQGAKASRFIAWRFS